MKKNYQNREKKVMTNKKIYLLIFSILILFISMAYSEEISSISVNYYDKSWEINEILKDENFDTKTGEGIYIPAEANFIKDLKISCSKSSSGETIAFHSQSNDIFFSEDDFSFDNSEKFDLKKVGFTKDEEGNFFIPLLQFCRGLNLNFSITEKQDSIEINIYPMIVKVSEKLKNGNKNVIFTSSAPVELVNNKDDDELANKKEIKITFDNAKISPNFINECKEIEVINETKEDSEDAMFNVIFPENWKGFVGKSLSGTSVTVDFLPNFNLKGGYTSEDIEKITKSDEYIDIEASGAFQYFWKYDQKDKKLNIEIPLLSASDIDIKELPKEINLNYIKAGYGAVIFKLDCPNGFDFSNPKSTILRISLKSDKKIEEKGNRVTGEPSHSAIIVIDPGHGGGDLGAVNRYVNVFEKDLNLQLALKLGQYLKEAGYKVIFTRTTDRDVTWAYSPDKVELQARADVGNINSACIFVSVHCNASVNRNVKGFAVYWTKQQDYELARNFENNFIDPSLDLMNRGAIRGTYYVLRHTRMPAIIVETAFVSNHEEAQKLKTEEFQKTIMKNVAEVLCNYLRMSDI